MEPASFEEIETIIRELMHDQGPPLILADDRGKTWVAGAKKPAESYRQRLLAREQMARERAEYLAEVWPGVPRQEAEAKERQALLDINRRLDEQEAKLAGDVFHGDQERMSLKAAIAKAINEGREDRVKEIAAEAIRKAVHGE